MAGIDDNVAIIGDWVPPSPSPRAFFTAMLGGDIGSNQNMQSSDGSRTEGHFLGMGSRGQMVSGNDKDGGGNSDPQMIKSNSFSEQKQNSRGGLVERMAARAGFNAPRLNTESIRSGDLSLTSDVRSTYLTIPPGLSPTSLLESPVFLPNSVAQPSPTTGKFPFLPNGNSRGSTVTEATDKSKDNFFDDINTSFAFKPIAESGSSFYLGATNKMSSATLPRQSFHSNEVSVHSEPSQVQLQSSNSFSFQPGLSMDKDNNEVQNANAAADQTLFGSAEQSPPLDEQHEEEGDQRGSGESVGGGGGGAPSQDGYNWRKYGQKQVKGSEYPRSYYKCTHPNCQVKKKVERSHEGHITEIIYKGAHNHAKPAPNRRSAMGSSNQLTDMQLDFPEQGGADGDALWASSQKGTAGTPDWRPDNFEASSTAAEYCNPSTALQGQNHESGEALDASSTFSNDEEEDDRGTHGSVSLGYDGEGDESESKRRKIEAYATEMSGATRAIREPRVVVQTTSEVDILDDGYRWRKYGQKVVKGNPNPRSYYKCTSAGCTVRKHVERASHDLKSVITTYEGKHNHDVPAARNSSHVNAGASNTGHSQAAANASAHVHRPEASQVHNSMARFSMPGRQQLGPLHGFSFGMNQPGLANLGMAGLGPGQGKLPVMHVHPYMAQQQQRQVNEMGFMMPKGEPKMELISESGMNLSNGSSVYQLMSQLPLGPHM